jgi:hypothetical protein
MKYSLLVLLAAATTASAAGDTICSLDEQFRTGTATGEPCGKTSGKVLIANGAMPKVKARIQSLAWKGKTFHGDGTFTNRWLGFEAISATTAQGTSWFDGQPCLVMQYPEKAPIFGGVRDELREVSPGVWLGRSYDGATGSFKNYFRLEQK